MRIFARLVLTVAAFLFAMGTASPIAAQAQSASDQAPSYSVTSPAPMPAPTVNLVQPTASEPSPIEVTKFWTSVESVTHYYAVCLLCYTTLKVPEIHWDFISHGEKVAKAIRFVLQEVSPFGEVEHTGKMDLTGTFAPAIQIEGRNNIRAALRGQGTHWNIIVTEILWADGTMWKQVGPTPVPAQADPLKN